VANRYFAEVTGENGDVLLRLEDCPVFDAKITSLLHGGQWSTHPSTQPRGRRTKVTPWDGDFPSWLVCSIPLYNTRFGSEQSPSFGIGGGPSV